MDLISRETVKKHILDLLIPQDVDDIPSAFEGMTNGEVMKAVFPKISVFENIDVLYSYIDVFNPDERDMPMHSYNKAWWNSPYQKGGEGDK